MPPGRAVYRPGLLTDMYHPDSAYVSWRAGLNGLTTFELFARRAPFGGSYLLVAGLEAALDFADEDLEFVGKPETLSRLDAALAQLASLLRQFDERTVSGRLVRVALRLTPPFVRHWPAARRAARAALLPT